MYFSVTVLLAAVATVSASTSGLSLLRRQYPDCATSCLIDVDYHGCGQSDISCLCGNDDYVKETTACIVNSCDGDEETQALGVAEGFCESVGITLDASEILPSTALTSVTPTGSSTAAESSATESSDSTDAALNMHAPVFGAVVAVLGISLL